MHRPPRRSSAPRSRAASRRPVPPRAAEVLEDRALLSATFALDASHLALTGFTQTADENLTVRENGTSYEFVLSEGTWAGTDGAGVTGAGTGTLAVAKAAVAGLAGGIDVDAAGVQADVALQTADFSTLSGGLTIVGTDTVSQEAGQTLETADLLVGGRRAVLEGTIDGGAGDVEFWMSRDIVVDGATITTTSGAIALRCTDFTIGNGYPPAVTGVETGNYTGVRVVDSAIATATGAVTIVGRGGDQTPQTGANQGVEVLDSTIRSTGLDAGQVTILGFAGNAGTGVFLLGAGIRSVEGSIAITGYGKSPPGTSSNSPAVGIFQGTVIASEGTWPNEAAITIVGGTDAIAAGVALASFGNTRLPLVIDPARLAIPREPALVTSVDGGIAIDGQGGRAGVEFAGGRVVSTGGPSARDVTITGRSPGRGVYVAPQFVGAPPAIEAVDADVYLRGTSSSTTGSTRQREALNYGQGILLAGRIATTGDGAGTLAGAAAGGFGAVVLTSFISDFEFGAPAGVAAAAGNVWIYADDLDIGPRETIVSTAGAVTIETGGGREIDLGGEDTPESLGLSNRELNAIGTLRLRIGGDNAGDIRLVGPVVRRYGAGTLELITIRSVIDADNFSSTDLTVDGLQIQAQTIGGPQAGAIDVSATSFGASHPLFFIGPVYLNNAGDLTITGLTGTEIHLFVDGSTTIADGAFLDLDRLAATDPASPPPVTIFSSSAEPVVGTFLHRPEGSTDVTSRGQTVRITYRGGDGNDVVVSVDQRPVVEDERIRVREDETASGNVLTNDGDPDNDPLTVVNVNGGSPVGDPIFYAGGVLIVDEDGSFTFDPNGGFDDFLPGESRTVAFRYTVSDGSGRTNVGEATIVIYGAGRTDLVGYVDGDWYVTAFNGFRQESFLAAEWEAVAWDALLHADANGDGRSDVIGLIDGQWWIGYAYGALDSSAYWTVLADSWSNAAWQDATLRDLNGDGMVDLLARVGGEWWAALSDGFGGSYLTPAKWAAWTDAAWDAFFVDDANADGRDDLIGYFDGEWWVGLSTGTGFATATLWERWANVEWQGLGTFDVNGDGAADLFGMSGNESYYGMSLNSGQFRVRRPGFATRLHGTWQGGTWEDVRAGDFDGDGLFNDLAARNGGDWHVVLSHLPPRNEYIPDAPPPFPEARAAVLWADWAEVTWEDVRTGDFDGDGRTDLVGRYQGEWYLARALPAGGFASSLWATWAETDWQAVAAVDFDGLTSWAVPAGSGGSIVWTGSGTSVSYVPSLDFTDVVMTVVTPPSEVAATSTPIASEDEPLGLFWSQAEEDEAFADGLLAAGV